MGVKHVRGQKTPCTWSMTPSNAVLVTNTQVLLCPFITDDTVKPPQVIDRAACQRVQQLMPDGLVPVGCNWNQRDESAVPQCMSTKTPNYEMRMVRQCDVAAYENLQVRVRSTILGEQNDCKWRSVGSGQVSLYCSVIPQTAVMPAVVPPARDLAACDALVQTGSLDVGCVMSQGKVKCLSSLTEIGDMSLLKRCDIKTWRLINKLVTRVAHMKEPAPCRWVPLSSYEDTSNLVCPLN